jgi:undecaprenyl diphosphate synthase
VLKELDTKRLPRHIAIIMDGNGRWAKKRGLPRILGHREGTKTVKEIVSACAELGIEVLTLYAFSTENWSRPKAEISGLMKILERYLKSEIETFMDNNVRLAVIGDMLAFPENSVAALRKVISLTDKNTGMVLNLALNYGGRQEVVRAANLALKGGAKQLTEKLIEENLYTAGQPDPDLLIRTSGEMRVSNFLLWQLAYTEFFVTETLWPDFKKKHLYNALEEYQNRDRRFGGLSPSSETKKA